jgi:hypothetical protein
MSGSSTSELLSLLNANRIILLLINVKPVLPTRLEGQGNGRKASGDLSSVTRPLDGDRVCVPLLP